MSPSITIKDIAQHFGVSVSTVSRALSDNSSISAQRRQEIQEYARLHHYHLNTAASQLRTSRSRKSQLIGVVLPQFVHYYFSCILTAIEEYFSSKGYNIIAAQTGDSYENEVAVLDRLRQQQVAGIIISQAKDTAQYKHFEGAIGEGIPMVFVDRICTGLRTSRVVVDDYAGAFAATEYLIQTGCKRIAYLGTTMRLEISKNRYNGYRDAMRKHNLQLDSDLVCLCDNREQAEILTPQLLSRAEKPDGFFAINDDTALGVLYSCKKMGVRVPEEISICGFADGVRAISSDPQLTTVEQRGHTVGNKAAEVLMDTINGVIKDDQYVSRLVKTKLVIRGTTKPTSE